MGNFRTSNSRKAWEKFVAILQRNPELKKVKVWRTWDGSPDSAADYSAGQAPWVRLTPRPLKSGYLDNAHHESPFEVSVETVASETTDIGEGMDLHEAIMRSFWPGEATKQAALDAEIAATGMTPIEMTMPSWGLRRNGQDGGLVLYGSGTFTFTIYPETRSEYT